MIASTPLDKDGVTKIETDIIRYNNDFHWTIACADGFNTEYGKWMKSNNIDCLKIPSKRNIMQYNQRIKKIVKKGNFDSVYVHGNSAMMLLQVLPAKMAGAKRIITHCHNTQSDFPIIHYLIKPIFNSLVDVKLACSESAAKWAYCGKHIKVITNGIEPDRFTFNPSVRKQVRTSIGWTDNYIIGHVGRFNKQKNHRRLIDIFEKCHKRDSSCRLLLIGEGELKEDIKQYVYEKQLTGCTNFLGSTDCVEKYYNAMDAFLMPSVFEGFCIAAVEAQANGLHVVMSDCIPPEAYLTKNIETLSLSQSDDVWSDAVLDGKSQIRGFPNYVKGSNFDENVMMQKIRKVLLNT